MKRVLRSLSASNIAGPLIGLVLVMAFFSLFGESRHYFLSAANLKIILTQSVDVGICALGMTLIIICGGIDLSVGSAIALSSVAGALALRAGYSPEWGIATMIAVGGLIGLINGLCITKLRVAAFIVTLGMLGIARGLAKWLANNLTVVYEPNWLNGLMITPTNGSWQFAPGVWVLLAVAIVMGVLLHRTIFGRHVIAVGSNEAAARLCGIRVDRVKIAVYVIGGLLFGLAGLMQLARLRQGDPTVAIGRELDVIAAAVIGGASLRGGRGSIIGSLIGALLMPVLRNGTQQMGWPTYVQEIIIGAVIIAAVALDRWRYSKAIGR